MENLRIYIRVGNLENSVHFLTEITELFKIEFNDKEASECILSLRNNDTLTLCVKEHSESSSLNRKPSDSDYIFAIGVNDCRAIFDNIKNLTDEFDWRISQEFFGAYLSTPIGDQFAIIEKTGNKILIFDKIASK